MSVCACDSKKANKVYTVEDWLLGRVNFAIPSEAAESIFAERGINKDTPYTDVKEDVNTLRLLKADIYKYIVLGASKVNNTSDSDNGWSHSEGGYNLSKDDKKLLMAEANDIYEELEPGSVFGKRYTKVHSMGIMPARRDLDGVPMPRHIQ